MANIKFSAFTQKVVQTNVDFLVGYTGADNVRITPAALGDGIYLPLGGGTMTGTTSHGDSVYSYWGASNDLRIYHNGADSHIDNYTGNLNIVNNADDKDINFYSDDGSGGVTPYITLDGSQADGTYTYTVWPDNSIIALGTGSDVQMYHTGTNSFITNSTGDFIITNNANDADIQFKCDDGAGGTTLYYYLDGSIVRNRFPKNVYLEDNVKLLFGDASTPDLEIYHDGSNSYIQDTGTGNLLIDGANNVQIRSATDSAVGLSYAVGGPVYLYHAGSLKFNTTATGIEVTDEVSIGTSLVHTGDTDTKVSFGTDEIVLTTAGTDRVTVNSSGNVGIGDASPTSISANTFSLSVNSARSDLSGGLITKANGTVKHQQYWDSSGYGFILTASSGDFKWNFGGSEKMRLTETGKVGIGTATMNQWVNITSDSNSTTLMQLRTADDSEIMNFGIGSDVGYLYMESNTDMTFGTNGGERMRITNTGLIKTNSSGTTNHETYYKTGTYYKLSTGSTTAMTIVKVGHTHAVNYTVIAKVDTSNVGTLVGNTATAYGSNGGIIVDSEAYTGVVTDIAVTYDNSYYGLNVAVTYTGATAPHIWMAVKGQSSEDFVAQ